MKLAELVQRSAFENRSKSEKRFRVFNCLLLEIEKKDLPDAITDKINSTIKAINEREGSDKELARTIKNSQVQILKLLEKELKIVPKNHYRTLWMAIGMGGFGIPIGLLFSIAMDQMAFLGIGLPIGMTLGMAIGAGMDKKAIKEGRQLDIEINY